MEGSLLRDWDLLQGQVMPELLAAGPALARIWSIGDPTDAVALTAAFSHAKGGKDRPQVTVFASGEQDWKRVNFNTSDLRCLSIAERGALFHRQDRHWVPKSPLSDHIRLGEPGGPVDLIALRSVPGDLTTSVLARLRGGGQLFVSEGAASLPGLRRDDGDRRLFHKDADGHGDSTEGRGEDPSPTLATWQQQQDLVTAHVGLARSLARRFAHRGESVDDLVAVAQLALVSAARRYDESRGTAFPAYAAACIVGELKRHFRDRGWAVRVPRPLQELYLAAKDAREELGHELGRSPTVAEIADHLEVSEEQILEAMEAGTSYRADSLDAQPSEDDRPNEIGMIDPAYERIIDRERLIRALPHLDERERTVLRRIFFDEYTQQQVAGELGVSQMQVSRILARSIQKLRR